MTSRHNGWEIFVFLMLIAVHWDQELPLAIAYVRHRRISKGHAQKIYQTFKFSQFLWDTACNSICNNLVEI